MQRFRYTLLALFALLIGATSCSKLTPKKMLGTIPEDVEFALYTDMESLLKLTNPTTLSYLVEPDEEAAIIALRDYVAWEKVLLYGTGDNYYITLPLDDYKAFEKEISQLTDSISIVPPFRYTHMAGWSVAYTEEQLWLGKKGFYTELFEGSRTLIANPELPSLAQQGGIEKLLESPLSLYYNPTQKLSHSKWLKLFAPERQSTLLSQRVVVNATFDDEVLQARYYIVDKAGKPLQDEYSASSKINRKVLEYISPDNDWVMLQGVAGEGLLNLIGDTESKLKHPEWQALLHALKGTTALAVKMIPESTNETDEWSLLLEVRKKERDVAMESLLKLLDISPQTAKRMGEDYIVSHPRYGNFYLGMRDSFIFLSSRAVDKFTPSWQDLAVAEVAHKNKYCVMVNLAQDSHLSQYIQQRYGYAIDGYMGLSAQSVGQGRILLYNPLEKAQNRNILEGMLQCLKPIPVQPLGKVSKE